MCWVEFIYSYRSISGLHVEDNIEEINDSDYGEE